MKKIAFVLALVAVGCGAAHEEDTTSEETSSNDPVEKFSSDGLTVEHSDKSHVDGVFTRDGATLRFDISRDGDVRHMLLTSANGAPLVDSTLAGGIDTAIYLGGKAKMIGRPNEEPKREGDEAAFNAFASSDARIFPELKEALFAAKIERSIFLPAPAAAGDGVRPDMYQAWGSDGNVWTFLTATGDWWGFWSWSGWGWTTVMMGNAGTSTAYGAIDWNAFNNNYVSAYVQAGCCASEWVSGQGFRSISRQWWGAYITVTNKLVPFGGCYWKGMGSQCTASASGTVCQPAYYVYTCDAPAQQKVIVRKF